MKFNIFELGIFSFKLYVYYLTRGFIVSTRAFNLLTRVFNLPTRAFSVPTRAFNLATRAFSLLTRVFELVTRGSELVIRGLELLTRGFEVVTRNLCFTFPLLESLFHRSDVKQMSTRNFHGIWWLKLTCLPVVALQV